MFSILIKDNKTFSTRKDGIITKMERFENQIGVVKLVDAFS